MRFGARQIDCRFAFHASMVSSAEELALIRTPGTGKQAYTYPIVPHLQIPLNIVLWGCDSSTLKQSHLDKLTAFHHTCARWLVNVMRWDCRFNIYNESNLHDLELPTMEQIRILRYLEKVAHMPGSRLTLEVLRSHRTCRSTQTRPKDDAYEKV
jgi:hypothetical protein